MKVEDFATQMDVKNEQELEEFLTRRFDRGVNGFFLTHELRNPSLSILVKGELATLLYFPKERHPGFRSIGSVHGLDPEGTTTFFLDRKNEEQKILNDAVVPLADAISVAKEFFSSSALPHSIKWFEL